SAADPHHSARSGPDAGAASGGQRRAGGCRGHRLDGAGAGRHTPSAAGHPPSSRLIGHAVRPRGSALRVVPVVLILSATLIVVLVGGSALVAVLTLPTIVLGRRIRTRRGLLCAGFGTCIGF